MKLKLLVSLAIALTAPLAAPAHAAPTVTLADLGFERIPDVQTVTNRKTPFGSCADDRVCLYQWVQLGGERWQSTISNIINNHNGCLNLSPATWSNGTPVNDNTAGHAITHSGIFPNRILSLYNYVNCPANSAGGRYAVGIHGNGSDVIGTYSGWMYHGVTSIGVTYDT